MPQTNRPPNLPTKPQVIFATLSQIGKDRTPREVTALPTAALLPFGLRHHVIGRMPTEGDANPTGFMFQNWPEVWSHQYFDRNYASTDPVPRAAMTYAFDSGRVACRHGRLDEYFAQAARLSGGKGLIVPIQAFRAPDRARLHLLVIYARDRMLTLSSQPAAQFQLSARKVQVPGMRGDDCLAVGHFGAQGPLSL